MQRGYIPLIAGAALLISGIVISALWTVPFAGIILRENSNLSGASIIASTQVVDTSRPISLAARVEHSNGTAVTGQIPNHNIRETVRNPKGIIKASNEFTGRFLVCLGQILLESIRSLSPI